MMIAATVNGTGTPQSIRTLINTAIPDHIPITFSGRVSTVVIQYASGGETHIIGSGVQSGSQTGFTLPIPGRISISFESTDHNTLSIDDIFIIGLGGNVTRILAFTS